MRLAATERDIQAAILDLLTVEGIFAFRVNSAAFAIDSIIGKRRFIRAHSLGAGAADIRADVRLPHFPAHVPLWLEVKTGTGRQSLEQVSFQEFVERHGHVYAVVRSTDDVLDVLWRIRNGGNKCEPKK